MFDIILNMIECSMIALFYLSFSTDNRCRTKISTVIYVLCSFAAITVFNTLSLNESFFFIPDTLMGYVFLSMITDLSSLKKLILSLLPELIIFAVSCPVTIILSRFFYQRIDYTALANEHYLLLTAVTQPLRAILFYFISKRIRQQEFTLSNKECLMVISILLLSTWMSVSVANLIYADIFNRVDITNTVLCIIILLIMVFFIFTDISFMHKTENAQKLNIAILENQLNNNRKLLIAQEELNRLRHDLKHFINITAVNDSDEVMKLKKKYNELLSKNVSPVNTPSRALNYVFSVKKQEAADKGIEFLSSLNIAEDIEMEDADLYLLLSNLLDNAIQHIGLKNKIYAEITCRDQQLTVRIMNSHDQKVLDDKRNIIHQRNDHHGYGIETVRTLLKKYNGTLFLDEDSSTFVALAVVPMTRKHS